MEKSLNFKISNEIPSDSRALFAALNRGVPFVISHPQSKASEAVRKMAEELTSSESVGTKLTSQEQGRSNLSHLKELNPLKVLSPLKGLCKTFGF